MVQYELDNYVCACLWCLLYILSGLHILVKLMLKWLGFQHAESPLSQEHKSIGNLCQDNNNVESTAAEASK